MAFEHAPERGEDHLTAKESGVFTWDLHANTVNADGALAKLFGLNPAGVLAGLPIEAFIERIHSEDRPKVAEAIHHAVLSGAPYHMEYRVLDADDVVVEVMAFGRCFRDSNGVPSQYAGIVFPVMDRSMLGDPVFAHVAMAHRHAVDEGRADVADALESILMELSRNQDIRSEAKLH